MPVMSPPEAAAASPSAPRWASIFNPAGLYLVQPVLRPVVAETLTMLEQSSHRWARPLAWVLRTRVIYSLKLPRWMAGVTNPFLPLIFLDRGYVWQGLASSPAGRARIMHTLLHESAHQLWAVWPEWRNWLGDRRHYGPEQNAADAIAEAIIREAGLPSAYSGRRISYVSPLNSIGVAAKNLRKLRHIKLQKP
jgi:hypothetical protein